jgi:hypothetical protein
MGLSPTRQTNPYITDVTYVTYVTYVYFLHRYHLGD